jgi:hypothetical protein
MKKKKLNRKIEEAIKFVFGYAGDVDEWIIIKKELLKALPSEERTSFSTRDPVTKKQVTNDFERCVAARWSELSGRAVLFSHDD